MNMQRAIAAAFIGLLVLFGAACEPTPSDSAVESSAEGMAVQDRSGITIGGAAPDFQLWNLDGKPVYLIGISWSCGLVEFLGDVVRPLPHRDAGDGAALSCVQSKGF